jgi:predicted PhzF superfamily epimerase YddE/YHI9
MKLDLETSPMTHPTAALVRAFVNADGEHGAEAFIVAEPDGSTLTDQDRQAFAETIGAAATVFVIGSNHIRIFGSYGLPIQFGGHPTLATIEALHSWGRDVDHLVPAAGRVSCRREDDGTVWVSAPAAWSRPWRHHEMGSADEVDALTFLPTGEDFTQVWSWIDKERGLVRARLWAPRINKGEDEACGSASMILADRLGRRLIVLHGRFLSRIDVIPRGDGLVELGGRCAIDQPSAEQEEQVRTLLSGALA